MLKFVSKTTLAIAAACSLGMAHADVLTFDDLGNSANFFVSNYKGFTFGTNNIATTAFFYTSEVSVFYTPHSGSGYIATDFQLYPDNGLFNATQPISSATPFVFNGAWFSGGDQVRYQLYLGGVLKSTSANSGELGAVPTFVSSGYTGLVDSVVIVGKQGFYAMDDFTFTPSAVPEPTTYGLMGAGLLALAAVVRRRRAR